MKRTVVFIAGYDLRRAEASFGLMKSELETFLKLNGVSGSLIDFHEGAEPGGCSASWTGRVDWPEGRVETRYIQLGWRDLARRDFQRSWLATVTGAAITFFRYTRSGGYWSAWKSHWPHGLSCLYPPVTFLLYWFTGLGLPVFVMLSVFTGASPFPPEGLPTGLAWAGLFAASVAWFLGVHGLTRLIEPKSFFWYLVHDWYAIGRLARNEDPEMSARIEAFADRITAIADQCEDDEELLLTAHSSGTFVAVYTLAAVLRKVPDFGQNRGGVTFLTVGSAFGYVGGFGAEHGFGQAIAALAASPRVDWTDIYAPHDILGCGRLDPVARYAKAYCGGILLNEPRRFSARIPDRMETQRYRHLRFRFFQLHFCYFFASIRRDIFDFYQLTLGSRPVKKQLRIWDPAHNPDPKRACDC